MKITKVDIMQEHIEGQPQWRPVLIRVYTDEGIYGDGEAALAYGSGAAGVFGELKDLCRFIIGRDPLDNEAIWETLYKMTIWAQNGGPIIFSAMSAIDIALWDIKGKYFHVPVYKLLGGKLRNELRCYASQLQYGWDDHEVHSITPEDYASAAKKAVAEGYDAVKVDFTWWDAKDGHWLSKLTECTGYLPYDYLKMFEDRISAVREAVGPSVDIIWENHSTHDITAILQLAEIAKKYRILFCEEPNTPNRKTAEYLRDHLGMDMAHGERLYSRWQFAEFFEDQSLRMIQPDLGTCGGITEGKKICDMAHIYDVVVQIHVCGSPLSTAASLQLESVIPNFAIHEHHVFNRYDYNKDLCLYDLQPVNGKFTIPDKPGIGNELSEKALTQCEKYTLEKGY